MNKMGNNTPKVRDPVYDKRDSEKIPGVVIRPGDEVSEVKWSDGTTTFTTNDYLKPIKET